MTRPDPIIKFVPLPWDKDPLRGSYGLSWYQRKPSSLTKQEERAMIDALADGRINASEYRQWKLYVE
jgi:hypothetical protein